MYAYNNV